MSNKELDFRQAVTIFASLILRCLNHAINMYVMHSIVGTKLDTNNTDYRRCVRAYNAACTQLRLLAKLSGMSDQYLAGTTDAAIRSEREVPVAELDS